MKTLLVLASALVLVSAWPEPPTSYSTFSSGQSSGLSFQNVPSVASLQYSAPSSRPSSNYGSPSPSSPSSSYGTPSASSGGYSSSSSSGYPQQSYGSPSTPSQSYGSPSQSGYQEQSQPANVQVSYGAPPQLSPGSSYGPPPMVTGAGPDHDIEYRVIYKPVKAPQPDVILPPPPPKQKTIVYILVPKYIQPDPIIVPTHAPTPPSKPEVYFIRYKAPKKNKAPSNSYGLPSQPSQQYGVASEQKPSIVEAPSPQVHKKREIVRVSASSSEVTSSSGEVEVRDGAFGERVSKSTKEVEAQ